MYFFGNSTSLNLDEINLTKQRKLETAKHIIACNVKIQNSKLPVIKYDRFKQLLQTQALVKGKTKPDPYGHRYRLIDIKNQTDKTVSDENNIKTHKICIQGHNLH